MRTGPATPSLPLPVLLLLMALLAACGQKGAAITTAPAAPPEVDVAQPLRHAINEWNELSGRFEAVERVDVRTRVTGYLVEKRFRDGQYVARGDVLFVIDQRPFQNQLQRARAQFDQARKAYERAENLRSSQAMSQEVYDQRLNEMETARVALNEAELDLEFTEVKAPIDGKISEGFVDTGNLVRENETVLTRIVTLDPIHFEFEGSQGDFIAAMRLDRAGLRQSSDTAPNPIFIRLIDEQNYVHLGRMEFLDNAIDNGTGTMKGRALVQNTQAIIYPGMFGRARISSSGEYEATLLPEKAILNDQSRRFVYVVGADEQATRVYVSVGRVLDNGLVVIREGLTGDERVVVNGSQRIRGDRQRVSPVLTALEWSDISLTPDPATVPPLEEITRGS
ncbi:MAG: efflux RND transporter periplasmic adaptor subunit, partial [Parahaliea sp.]